MNIKSKILIKILDEEIWLYKNNKIYIEKTNKIIDNNFITNYKLLEQGIKKLIKNFKLSNVLIQNKIYILINKLYCETNILVIRTVMYDLGLTNYKLIYEEDLYKDLYTSILSIWKTNGIMLKDNVENYIDINKKEDIKKILPNTLLITSSKNILTKINKNVILYEHTNYPIFNMFNKDITNSK